MDLPGELLEQSVEVGKIYFFRDDCPIGIKGHMHVCIKIHDRVYMFSTCTSQLEKIRRYTALTGVSLDTYPCFHRDDTNKFDKEDTCVNCNNVIECSAEDFTSYLTSHYIVPFDGVIDSKGMLSIARGVRLSKTVPKEIQDLF